MLQLPMKVGVLAISFTKDRFRQQNWLDTYPEPWKKRKASKWGKKRNDSNRALLVKRAQLLRSIRIVNTTHNSVTIGSNEPHAAVHNDGFRGRVVQNVGAHQRKRKVKVAGTGRRKVTQTVTTTVKAHSRTINQNIPRRRYMGKSQYLSRQISRLIAAEINKTFRQ